MKLLIPPTATHASAIVCTTCATHRRPQDVPWHQHTVGCPVRAGAIDAGRAAAAHTEGRSAGV